MQNFYGRRRQIQSDGNDSYYPEGHINNSSTKADIHLPCYCTVLIYVAIHVCDSESTFCVEGNQSRFCIVFFFLYLSVLLKIQF